MTLPTNSLRPPRGGRSVSLRRRAEAAPRHFARAAGLRPRHARGTGVPITPLDLADEADLTAHHQVLSAGRAVDVPDLPELPLRQVTLALRHPMPASEVYQVLARVDGEPAGALALGLPTHDLHLAIVELFVRPRWRRRSVGRTLFATALEVAHPRGRTALVGDCVTELPGGPARDPGHAAFAAAMGAPLPCRKCGGGWIWTLWTEAGGRICMPRRVPARPRVATR